MSLCGGSFRISWLKIVCSKLERKGWRKGNTSSLKTTQERRIRGEESRQGEKAGGPTIKSTKRKKRTRKRPRGEKGEERNKRSHNWKDNERVRIEKKKNHLQRSSYALP